MSKLVLDAMWAVSVFLIRRARRRMNFGERLAFDDALRPHLRDGAVVAYPDALYHIKAADIERARDTMKGERGK